MIIGDLETNGLYPDINRIWCACFVDLDSDQTWDFTPETIGQLPEFLNDQKGGISFHNWFGFDGKVLKKMFNYQYPYKIIDTLILSRLLFPDFTVLQYTDDSGKTKSTQGPHSVESWGVRLGLAKPVHEDWSRFSPEMLIRCQTDAQIQKKILIYLLDYINNLKHKDPRIKTLDHVIDLEQKEAEIIEAQADYGWSFDLESALKLKGELGEIVNKVERELTPLLPVQIVKPYKDTPCSPLTKSGQLTSNCKKWMDKINLKKVPDGQFSRVLYEPLNLSSSDQVKRYLLDNGWKPKNWNVKKDRFNKPVRDYRGRHIKTSPKTPETVEEWEKIANMLNTPEIKHIVEYNKASKRLSTVKGLIDKVRQDGRIECQANTCSTNTRRMAHRIVVNIPKADPKVYYGKEMRALFKASEGFVQVGGDASALEARIEGHYVYPFDKAAALELIEGDIHTKNASVWGVERNTAKSGKYALVYGCSPTKLAATLGKPKDIAQDLYDAFWAANPGLKELKDRVEYNFDKFGYLLSIDGAPLTIRYRHALINTLFQSAGAISMKKANILLDNYIKCAKLKAYQVGHHHDEFQFDSHPQDADQVGIIIVKSMREAGEYFKLNIPLDGEYKIGKNWAETH